MPLGAKWEFAARGGNKSRGYSFAGSDTLADVMRVYFGADEFDLAYIPGQMTPNELGIHDMSSPASEWVLGPWTEYEDLESAHNPGRISAFDFAEPFFLIQKGGNVLLYWLPHTGVNPACESSFRPENRIRVQTDELRPVDMAARFVRRASL